MRSAVAELIGAFLEAGGRITRCPDGIGLGTPMPAPKMAVGHQRRQQAAQRIACRKVIAALRASAVPLTLLGIEKATGIPYDRLRPPQGALQKLMDAGEIEGFLRPGSGNARFYQLIAQNTGTGLRTGGPTSESAGAACAGACSPAPRDRGSEAA